MKSFGIYSKRIFLFLAINFLIVFTLQLVMSLILPALGIQINNLTYLFILYSLFGMGGAFVSLWMSKWAAIRYMGVQILKKNDSRSSYQNLIQKVNHLSKKAGLRVLPEVGIYDSPEVNAFATGPSKSNSLVAVSTGLLNRMNEQEVEGVLAHEVAHIANGDMVTMTLVQGIVNTMIYIIAHLLAHLISSAISRGRNNWMMEWLLRQFLVTILYIPGSMVVCFFSRWREYRADRGGAQFAGRDKMIAALQSLQQEFSPALKNHNPQQDNYNYLKINNAKPRKQAFNLFSTHPPIEDRIHRLQRSRIL